MAGIGLKIDPVGEDAANVVLDLSDGTKFRAIKALYPTPDRDVNWASSADTEGALPANLRYQNRTITIECRVYGTSSSDLQTQLGNLEQKVGKINEEGGTHEYVAPSGVVCVFDLLEASADYELDNAALANKRAVVMITFTAKPFWRSGLANETAGIDHAETTLPCVIGVDTAVGGDVPALGRLVIDDDQGVDQWTLLWGTQSRFYDSSADAALFYQAESRTPQSGAATSAATSGASGAGSNTVLLSTLIPNYQSVLSTQASGGGNHLKHVGNYRIVARIYRPVTNTGKVSLCLEWAQGDFLNPTRNAPVSYLADELEGQWTLADLGQISLSKTAVGAQQWEGRVLAASTVNGDGIHVDCLMLFPVDEGYGELKVVPSLESPTLLLGHDEFDQSAGNLDAPKTAPLGGNWSEVNRTGANGFQVETTAHKLQRTTVSDEATAFKGSWAILGTATPTATAVQVTLTTPDTELQSTFYRFYGVFSRYTSITNFLLGAVTPQDSSNDEWRWSVWLGTEVLAGGPVPGNIKTVPTDIRLIVDKSGRWQMWVGGLFMGSGQHAALVTGGASEKGKFGIFDQHSSPTALTRSYDNFVAFTPGAFDAAVFASQSADVRSDRMLRENPSGTLWVPRTDYKGAYFRTPPARREARSVRTIVKLSRGNVDTMADAGIDDASFKIFWQARGLVLPES